MAGTAVRWTAGLGSALLVLEIAVRFSLRFIAKDFPWVLSGDNATERPNISDRDITRYEQNGFDPELGWCRKPFTRGFDRNRSDRVIASFHIDGNGARATTSAQNPGPSEILCFGDSFTFCRLVDDEDTWPEYLTSLTGRSTSNFGVGNYGLDQALLRCRRTLNERADDPPMCVVMGVVPETMVRIHSAWKHYFEYGNVLGFKPRFRLCGSKLQLLPSPIKTSADLRDVTAAASLARTHDYFARRKFDNDRIGRCALASLVRRHSYYVPILSAWLSTYLHRWRRDRHAARAAGFESVLRSNHKWSESLYETHECVELLHALFQDFFHVCLAAGARPLVVILPQPPDLVTEGVAPSSWHVLDSFEHEFPGGFLNLCPLISQASKDGGEWFIEGALGPHGSPLYNRTIAAVVAAALDLEEQL